MTYKIEFTDKAVKHLYHWQKSGQKKILKKIASLLEELRIHPDTGTGQVEELRGNLRGYYSRRIDKGNRLVYKIEDDRVIVTVISMLGHY